jgi:NADPH:quinone reductase-like Zn-dependent oxidoreductase
VRQIQFSAPGDPAAVVTCAQVDDPVVSKPNDVLVRVDLFPINPADLSTLQGFYPRGDQGSLSLGVEATGTVQAVGSSVDDVAIGDRVLLATTETWSELKVVSDRQVVRLSATIDPRRAARLKVNPATGALLLREFATLGAGDWIVQNAANSAVGRAVAELARHSGVRTVNIVRRPELLPALRDQREVVLLDGEGLPDAVAAATNGAPVRLGLDAVGGDATGRLAACVADRGSLVIYGAAAGQPALINPATVVFRDIRVRGFWLTGWLSRTPAAEIRRLYAELEQLGDKLDLTGPVDSVMDASDIQAAVARAIQIGATGKVLVTFG